MSRWILALAATTGLAVLLYAVLLGPLPTDARAPSQVAAPTADPLAPTAAGNPGSISTTAGDVDPADVLVEDDLNQDWDDGWPDDWLTDSESDTQADVGPVRNPVTPQDFSAIEAGESAAVAFARPQPGDEADWWPAARSLLSSQAVLDYEGTNPTQIGYTAVTGPGRLLAADSHTPEAVVEVPTDTGTVRVVLEPDQRAETGWVVIAWSVLVASGAN